MITEVSGQRLEWTKVRTNGKSQGGIIFTKTKINVSTLLRVLANKINYEVQWPKPTYLQPILTFAHFNLCPSTDLTEYTEYCRSL